MEKPVYKYATLWGVLAGTGLAFVYLKTLGKGKNLNLTKTLLIGGAIGAGIGLGYDFAVGSKPKPVTEEDLKKLAKDSGTDTEGELSNYLYLLKQAKLSPEDYQKGLDVVKGLLLAKKDNKWDEKADLDTKKKILMSYGVTEDDFKVFQDVIVKGLSDIIKGIFSKTNAPKTSQTSQTGQPQVVKQPVKSQIQTKS